MSDRLTLAELGEIEQWLAGMLTEHESHEQMRLEFQRYITELRRAWQALASLRKPAIMVASEPGPQVFALDVLCQIVRILPEDWPR